MYIFHRFVVAETVAVMVHGTMTHLLWLTGISVLSTRGAVKGAAVVDQRSYVASSMYVVSSI